MKKLLFLLTTCAYGQVFHYNSTSVYGGGNLGGSLPVESASLVVGAMSSYDLGHGTMVDDNGGTWLSLTGQSTGSGTPGFIQLWYRSAFISPPTDNLTIHDSGSQLYGANAAMTFGQTNIASPVNGSAVNNSSSGSSVTSIATGSIAHAYGEVLITAISFDQGGGPAFIGDLSITGGYKVVQLKPSGSNFGIAYAYRIANTAGTDNPTWSWSGSPAISVATTIAAFTADSTTVDPYPGGNPFGTPGAGTTLATFTLAEPTSNTWSEQPIEFRYDGGSSGLTNAKLWLGDIEVPFQWLATCIDPTATLGCILVRSLLPTDTTYVWTLKSGTPPTATPVNPVVVATVGNNYEMTNGLTGIRIPTAAGNGTPWNQAPVQGIKLVSGTWSGAGGSPNLIYTEAAIDSGNVGMPLQTPAYTVTGYSVTVTGAALKTIIQATYTFTKPRYFEGAQTISPAGTGHYIFTATLYANSKSFLISEDSDMLMNWDVPIYAEVHPNVVKFLAHDSVTGDTGFPNPLCGYATPLTITAATNATPIVITVTTTVPPVPYNGWLATITGVLGNTAANGNVYLKSNGYSTNQFGLYSDAGLTTPISGSGTYTGGPGTVKPSYTGLSQYYNPSTGTQDIDYSIDRPAGERCRAISGPSYAKLSSPLPPASLAAGLFNLFYDTTSGSSAPVVGIFNSDFSTLWFSVLGGMPGFYSSNSNWITGAQAAGIQVDNLLRAANGAVVGPDVGYAVRKNWGIYVSTAADIQPDNAQQLIQTEQNTLNGINLTRIVSYNVDYGDPGGGWKWLYLPSSAASAVKGWVRDGTTKCGSSSCYYDLLHAVSDQYGIAILNMWRANNNDGVQDALSIASNLELSFGATMTRGLNHFDGPLGYYQLGYTSSPNVAVSNSVLMDENTTTPQKDIAKKSIALFGAVFWDNDWFPIDNNSGTSGGLTNQQQQYQSFRAQGAAATEGANTYLQSKVPTGTANLIADLGSYFSSTGAVQGSTHYQSAFSIPTLFNYINYTGIGALDMTDPKWPAYANWELSIQTPPEPRFGNILKGESNGDGNTEADARPGVLANALQTVNPTVSGNMMWVWNHNNSSSYLTEDEQFLTTVVLIDRTLSEVAPTLKSINLPGYHSVARFGFAGPHETVDWFINGDFYQDGGHRHADDGQVSIYAHAAPLAIDWNANLYNPETPGRFYHNSIVLDSEIGHSWSADNPDPSDAHIILNSATNTEFVTLPEAEHSVATYVFADGTNWTRTVRTMAPNLEYPIIYVTDTFTGTSATAAKTLTWQTMATGAVTTPAGSITPTTRFSTGCQSPAGQFPSNGTVNALSNGLQAFHFTGVTWAAHATGGIDWDLYQIPSSGAAHFFLGNWGHGCTAPREAAEFATVNGVPFAETQHILRVNDTGAFTTFVLPYRKTETPTRTITSQSCGTQIVQGSETTCFDPHGYSWTDGTSIVIGLFDNTSITFMGYTLSGNTQGLSVDGSGHKVWTLSGATSGTRTLVMPSGTVTHGYTGGLQAAPLSLNPDAGATPVSLGGKIVVGGKTIIDH